MKNNNWLVNFNFRSLKYDIIKESLWLIIILLKYGARTNIFEILTNCYVFDGCQVREMMTDRAKSHEGFVYPVYNALFSTNITHHKINLIFFRTHSPQYHSFSFLVRFSFLLHLLHTKHKFQSYIFDNPSADLFNIQLVFVHALKVVLHYMMDL